MRKKLISFITALSMITALLPVFEIPAFAAGHSHDMSAECGATSPLTYTALNSSNFTGGALAAGNYYLASDIKPTQPITIAHDAVVNICLNGHVINGAGIANARSIIESEGYLSITDCDKRKTNPTKHYYTVGENGVYNFYDASGNAYTSGNSSTYLEGGVITGKNSKETSKAPKLTNFSLNNNTRRGAIAQTTYPGMELKLYNINVAGNSVDFTFEETNVYSDAITQNVNYTMNVHANGGGIYSIAPTVIENCTIAGNYLKATALHNETVTVPSGFTFTPRGNGYAKGAGVYCENTLTVKGSTFKSNKLDAASGGTVKPGSGSAGTIKSVSGAYTKQGGGIYAEGDGNVTISDSVFDDNYNSLYAEKMSRLAARLPARANL